MIKFKKPKKRQVFLRDMIALNVALSLVEVGSNGDNHGGELIVLHKNKDRKDLKKIKEKLERLKSSRDDIMQELEDKDIRAIQGLSKRFFKSLMNCLNYSGVINLECVAIQLINTKFTNRSDLHESLHLFTRKWGIHSLTGTLLDNDIETSKIEIELAMDLSEAIRKL